MPTDPPYMLIVSEIRRRIADGELNPGDRVLSTRQIAREWNVALATATKALNTLRQEGLVRAEPRVGTVVTPDPAATGTAGAHPASSRRRPAADSDHELTRERVVRAAVEIADAEGLDALSMRGIAARLGVATMSPYRYVNSKDDLILLMADAVFDEPEYPEEAPEEWRACLELWARMLWELYRRHPWLPDTSSLTRPVILPNQMRHSEWVLRVLDGLGLDAFTTFHMHVLVYSYVQGIATNLEREARSAAETGMSEQQWMDAQEPTFGALLGSGSYPTVARILEGLGDDYDLHLDEFFEFGLQPLLDGLAVLIERERPRDVPAR
ncbi:TetR/AcrR family transcriptional regulator C-terminal domain-containing protein [Microtetraspora glauca]|uniref:TetR/AcrR family transcriptional regulator C-terminal domain-containing protein n=1 Tax=Microtetraspora glauca TaxID=1996 RepID=A0ABV3GMC3_MICGL